MEDNKHKNQNRFISGIFIVLLIAFLFLIQSYLIALFLAAIFSGIFYPLFKFISSKMKGRRTIPAGIVIIIFLLIIVIPSFLIIVLVVDQASTLSKELIPLVKGDGAREMLDSLDIPDWVPFHDELEAQKDEIIPRIGELVNTVGNYLVTGLTSVTQGTVTFLLNLFIMVYAMFFFIIGGPRIMKHLQSYMPIYHDDFETLITRAFSVSKATLKGAIMIGIIQGSLVGLAFWVVGIEGSAFWGLIATFMSLIPSIGSAIVWIPAVIYLFLSGDNVGAIGLLIWGSAVVGSIDNLLRPMLVGNDTQIPDLIILISTLGGIAFFGISGIVIGPMLAGLLMTSAELYRLSQEENQSQK